MAAGLLPYAYVYVYHWLTRSCDRASHYPTQAMTIQQAGQILRGFGYDVYGYQAMGKKRRYCAFRKPLAEFCNLPIGGSFDKDGLKAFTLEVIASANS